MPPDRPQDPTARHFAAVAVAFVVIASFVAAVIVYFALILPADVLLVGVLLAVVPLVIVLIGIHLVDRWEPEPRIVLVFAFFWGAGVSIGAALLFDFAVQSVQSALGGGRSDLDDTLGAVVQAPIVEESAKGLGVLLVLWIFRRSFDGPIDGIVYAATVAAGFAFVENVQYFSVQAARQAAGFGGSLGGVFLVRALMAPFGHIIYTACTGFALGIAARRTGGLGAIPYFVAGLIPAILLHALWNGALVVVGGSFFAYYLAVQVPIFASCVVLVVVLRHLERRVTRLRLTEYAGAGWFDEREVAMLSSGRSRQRALRWARHNGVGPAMRAFVSDSTRLASTRQKLLSNRGAPMARIAAERDERDLLTAISSERSALQSSPIGSAGSASPFGPPTGLRSSTYDAYGAPAWPDPDVPPAVPPPR